MADGVVARKLTLAVFALALALRAVLVVVNVQANDDHLGVIRTIAYEHRLPGAWEDWEAFQPKLYHVAVAAALQLTPHVPRWLEHRIAQAVSAAAGSLTLLLLLRFLRRFELSESARLLTFSLIALNPKMISTSIQATNDAFVILFVSAAIFAGERFFRSGDRRAFWSMSGAAILAAISKGNGLVIAIAISGSLAGLVLHPDAAARLERLAAARWAALFLAVFLVAAAPLGGYWGHYQRSGSPFAINVAPAPPPHFYQETFVERPGVTSIVHGFLTFRLFSMLADPILTNGETDYVRHRTSVWSALYGRMHFMHFDGHPPAWIDRSAAVLAVGRASLIAALLPSAILVLAAGRRFAGAVGWLARGARVGFASPDLFLAVCMAGYLGFVLAYSYRYRDFAVSKAIFVYPALLAFAHCMALEIDRILAATDVRGRRIAVGSVTLLCALYVTDASLLIAKLAADLLG